MRRRLLLLSTLVALALALTIGIEAALAGNADPQQVTLSVSIAGQGPRTRIEAGVTVSKDGTGSGTVSSVPGGIECGPTCASAYGVDKSVTLWADPAAGSAFTGWSDACTGTRQTCKVIATAHPSGSWTGVTATFTLTSHIPNTLSISKDGKGYGTVSSVPAGIDCGSTCVSEYPLGTSVTLSAAANGDTFTGWSGACTGNGRCKVRLGAKSGTVVTATFALNCVVPKVKGMTLAAAERSVKAHACSVGRITHNASRTVEKGQVLSQKPKPGGQLTHRAKVNLVVSGGRRP